MIFNAKGITLFFENCEDMTIPFEQVKSLHIDEIHEVFHRIYNGLLKTTYADIVLLEISKPSIALFERVIGRKDITGIQIDGECGLGLKNYLINYNAKDSGAKNSKQMTDISSKGSLLISIGNGRIYEDKHGYIQMEFN